MMKDALEKAIRKYIDPTQDEMDKILQYFMVKEIPKGKYFSKSGQINNELAFIIKGCFRGYWEREHDEISGWFAFENEFFCDISSFIPQRPSVFGIQAIEDTTILYITHKEMDKLFLEVPIFERFIRKFWEHVIGVLVHSVNSFRTETAEKRYARAMQHPKLLQRVPLKYLSSFLGITPTSLSRLRKRR
jgi:CRP-like cAMP-binding protein